VDVTGRTSGHQYLLRASGSRLSSGYLAVYEEARNEDVKPEEDEENVKIPAGVAEDRRKN